MPYLKTRLEDARKHADVHDKAGVKGVIFEIDPVDFDYLHEVGARKTLSGHGDESKLIFNLRSLQRLSFYDYSGARAVVGRGGFPIPYWQPAMSLPLTVDKERKLFLMVYPFKGVGVLDHDVQQIISFLYDDLFGDAYDGTSSVSIDGFRPYVGRVRDRVLSTMQDATVQRLALPQDIRDLLERGRGEGLIGDL